MTAAQNSGCVVVGVMPATKKGGRPSRRLSLVSSMVPAAVSTREAELSRPQWGPRWLFSGARLLCSGEAAGQDHPGSGAGRVALRQGADATGASRAEVDDVRRPGEVDREPVDGVGRDEADQRWHHVVCEEGADVQAVGIPIDRDP